MIVGIDDAGEYHVAGNGIAGHGQGAADDPEDADEGDRGQQGVQNAQRKINQKLDRNPAVLGDARFGIVGLGVHDGQLVKMPVCEPTTDQCARQPLTPPHLQAHARMQKPDGKCR